MWTLRRQLVRYRVLTMSNISELIARDSTPMKTLPRTQEFRSTHVRKAFGAKTEFVVLVLRGIMETH